MTKQELAKYRCDDDPASSEEESSEEEEEHDENGSCKWASSKHLPLQEDKLSQAIDVLVYMRWQESGCRAVRQKGTDLKGGLVESERPAPYRQATLIKGCLMESEYPTHWLQTKATYTLTWTTWWR